jgi:peptidoglycan/xylan/chitin deacetylase (PgdA/CDA1 family)
MLSLHSRIGAVRRHVWCSFHSRLVPLGNRGPIVTFSFDDFPRTALTNGASIVERFGGRATYYVTMGLMDTDNHLGEQFRCADLRSLIERGHEVASHTFSHLSAQHTPFSVFRQDVERCEKAIRESIAVDPSNNFAYPYGEVTLSAKRQLGPRMRSCRGTCSGFNGPEVDLNLLRANSLYGDIDQAEAAKYLILENEARKSWLIFYSHDVVSTPSRFGCTPALLQAIVSFTAERGIKMMTVADVVAELC